MKKQNVMLAALVGFLSLAMSFDTQAQTKVWSIGPEAGISISKYGMDANENDSKVGAIGGLFITYSIMNSFGITGKFLFYQKGASTSATNTEQTLNYVEVPVLARFFLNKEGSFRPNIFLGPSIGFLTGVSQKVGDNDRERLDSYKDFYNGVDFGITGGVGFNLRIQDETYLILDARYTHGLSDLTVANGEVNNNSFALTAGVSFGF